MNNIAIITARGGSKRIPKKNIKLFLGLPIIAYSIKAAIESNCFSEVMVSTDSDEIAEISQKYGAKVPFYRSERTSNDYASTVDVLSEVISKYKENNKKFDYGCCIYPTAPFINSKKINDSYNKLLLTKSDTILSVVQYSFPPQRSLIKNNNRVEYWFPEYSSKRSQDLIPIYHDAGQFYWFNIDKFSLNHKLVSQNTTYFECSELEVQDIDTELDWKLAETKYKLMIS